MVKNFFDDLNVKKQTKHLFEISFFLTMQIASVTFDLFKASLLNKIIKFDIFY